MKNIHRLLFITLIIFILIPSFAFAANPRKGKYLYRKNCLSCHKYGTENQLGPDSKTQAEWETLFTKENLSQLKCSGNLASLSDKDRKDIHAHMNNHASDSPAPAACK